MIGAGCAQTMPAARHAPSACRLDSAAPGIVEQAAAVVDAVLGSSPADELDWIEWKSTLDLGGKPVRGTLARYILGMANRVPGQAAAHAGGRGFVVVGAEPGNRHGITAADPASLSQNRRNTRGGRFRPLSGMDRSGTSRGHSRPA